MKRNLIKLKKRCIGCGAILKPGQVKLCRRCELKIEAQSKTEYLKSLEQHESYRSSLNEMDAGFKEQYEKAGNDLEDIKFRLEEFED